MLRIRFRTLFLLLVLILVVVSLLVGALMYWPAIAGPRLPPDDAEAGPRWCWLRGGRMTGGQGAGAAWEARG